MRTAAGALRGYIRSLLAPDAVDCRDVAADDCRGRRDRNAAGCQLVASCDLAYASEAARFGVIGIDVGLFAQHPRSR